MYLPAVHRPVSWSDIINRYIFLQGANSYGQLGHGHTQDTTLSPVQVKQQAADIKDIVGGGGHTLYISGNNNQLSSYLDFYHRSTKILQQLFLLNYYDECF